MRKKVLMHILYVTTLLCYALEVGYPIRRFTGICCPFCGMTRAHLAALRGDYVIAFTFHPLFPLGIPFIFGIAHLRLLKKHHVVFTIAIAILVVICAMLLVGYVYSLL